MAFTCLDIFFDICVTLYLSARKKGKKKRDVSKDLTRDMIVSSPSCLLLKCYLSLSEGLAMVKFF